jgi:hypothetical protein
MAYLGPAAFYPDTLSSDHLLGHSALLLCIALRKLESERNRIQQGEKWMVRHVVRFSEEEG